MTDIQSILIKAVAYARKSQEGEVANYIPELALVNDDLLAVSVTLTDGTQFYAGDETPKVTLQSAAKIVLLIAVLEEYSAKEVFSWVKTEPSGDDFNSLARLDQFGPFPSNPMLNAGAIALCNYVPGNQEMQIDWLEDWMEKLFGHKCYINTTILASERRTGDRNRSLAYLMKSNGLLDRPVTEVLETYFSLCSFEISVANASYLPMLLANER